MKYNILATIKPDAMKPLNASLSKLESSFGIEEIYLGAEISIATINTKQPLLEEQKIKILGLFENKKQRFENILKGEIVKLRISKEVK